VEAGDRFGDYVIIKHLSTGGMAEVYLARMSGVGGFTKPVALKLILPHLAADSMFIKMFLDEARLAVALSHDHIAQILDLGEREGRYYIAMEFANGQDLQQITSRTRKSGRLLPLPYAAKIISQIAEGLFYAHTKTDNSGLSLGIVHRDVSPHNVILTFDGTAKLIDFGVAKARITYEEEEEGVLKGKFSYMSPEQIRGMPVDPRSDIFALGIVLWEICTGAKLYRESSELLTMEAILRKPVPKPRDMRGDMPPDLEAIILKALAKRAVDRFQSAQEMHAALESYLGRSGWNVGSPHLSEFMKKLFPEDYEETRILLAQEQEKVEVEQKTAREEFVPWEPYEHKNDDDDPSRVPGIDQMPRKPMTPQPAMAASRPAPRRSSPITWILVLLLLLLLAGAGFILYRLYSQKAAPTPAEKTAESGALLVESDPEGADLSVNGKPEGTTPVAVRHLPFGEELTVRIEKDGYEIYITPVVLHPRNPEFNLKAKLKKK
jgi:serine/threonine protein kinase